MKNKLREREREREMDVMFLCEKLMYGMEEKMSNLRWDDENKKSQNKGR